MDIHLDSRAEELVQRQLRSCRYHTPEQVVAHALEALSLSETELDNDRRQAVLDMMQFTQKSGFTLGGECSVQDLIREGRRL
jgi:hypothetical protein